MKITGSLFDPVRPDRGAPTQVPNPTGAPGRPVDPVAPVERASTRSDSVQISDSGRSLAQRLEAGDRAAFAPERVAELRRKVLEGAYNSLDVVDQVARRILTRGDL